MSNTDLVAILRSLKVPPGAEGDAGQVYTVRRVPRCPAAQVGVDSLSCPAFILTVGQECRPEVEGSSLVPFAMANLEVRHRVPVVLVDDAGRRDTGVFSIMRCPSQAVELHELFVRCVGHVLPTAARNLCAVDVNELVEHLIELFRLASAPAKGEALGLWAEMFVISLSSDPIEMIRAWRPTEYAHCDFGTCRERIEVKATAGPARRHHISFEQANPPSGVSLWIVSMLTGEIGNGLSVRTLWEQCVGLAGSNVQLARKVDQNCLRTLGGDWLRSAAIAFDPAAARASLRAYRPEDIPRIASLPKGVSQARWVADFEQATPTDLSRGRLSPMLRLVASGR